jgi:hypothetical protein
LHVECKTHGGAVLCIVIFIYFFVYKNGKLYDIHSVSEAERNGEKIHVIENQPIGFLFSLANPVKSVTPARREERSSPRKMCGFAGVPATP